ncbi:unnamed protein product [Rotaria sordida]|uniref:DUF202 domain-containing protein n=1 Tax=Rotaria sordida TaxID=392033 RepID=A0A818SXL5_9BILA|nr:unnamed protein product [Rotaria sordida]
MVEKESEESIPDDYNQNFTNYLANERTFLAWIRTGLTVFTLGCALARFSSSNSSSNLTTICGIGCLLYSFWRFFQTQREIKTKSAPNFFGPSIVLVLLLMALVAVTILLFFV